MLRVEGIGRSGRLGLLLLLLLLYMARLSAQNDFVLNGTSPKSMGKTVLLRIYDGDSTFRSMRARVKNGEFTFNGRLQRTTPATLQFGNGQELDLVLEAGEMTVEIDQESVERSRVNGSRSNSQCRYAMQQIDEGKSVESYVKENSSSELTAWVLYKSMAGLSPDEVVKLSQMIDSTARNTYHYHAIVARLQEIAAVAEGSAMPDFDYYTKGRKRLHYRDSVWQGCPTVLLFGATWCDKCGTDAAKARQLCGEEARLVVVDIDHDPKGWNAAYMKRLGVEHIPYIIVVDREGKIYARDVRVWELERVLRSEGRERSQKEN